jgi:hypothetical protein
MNEMIKIADGYFQILWTKSIDIANSISPMLTSSYCDSKKSPSDDKWDKFGPIKSMSVEYLEWAKMTVPKVYDDFIYFLSYSE